MSEHEQTDAATNTATDTNTDTTAAPASLEPLARRPGWPKPIGIVSIVLGSIAITCGVFGTAMIPLSGAMMGTTLGDVPPPPSTQLSPEIIVSMGIGVVTNILLIVAGIMTLKRNPRGRTLHLAYAIAAVVAVFLGIWAQMSMQAKLDDWIAQYGDSEIGETGMTWREQMQAGQQFQGISLVGGLVVGLAYPLFCIVWFGLIKKDRDAMGSDADDEEALY
ncbi:MAG: hypothetical protein AAF235_02000 [Planctomycetota bacterium]